MPSKKLFILPFAMVLAGSALIGCNSTKNDKNTLNVVCLNLGYGREWIDEAVAIWEAENPDYKVNLNATGDARSIVTANISKSGNVDDVYISVGSDWKKYAGGGKLLALDDLLEEEVDGVKIKDKVNDEYKNSIYFKDGKGETHTYRLPWTAGVGGIMYNAKMFRDNNWTVPTTTDELLALCQQMIDHPIYTDPTDKTSPKVYPFAYTGENTDYFDYAVFTWWSQISGVDAITEFKNYGKDDAEKFDASKNSTYAGLKQATQVWYNIFGNKAYTDAEDITRNNHQAQKNFMAGRAAMMINADWIYNEMLTYTSSHTLPENFELKIMDTPKIKADAERSAYIIGEDQYIAVPASTIKPDLAKSFIKTLVSDAVLKSFFNKAHGMMAYKLSSGSYETADPFMQSLADYRSHLDKTFTNFSMSPLFLNGQVDLWGATNGRPFQGLIKGTLRDVDAAFEDIANTVRNQWGTWVKNTTF